MAWVRDERNFSALLVAAAFVVVAGALVALGRGRPALHPGQVAAAGRINRIEYADTNESATAQRRDDARRAAPRVYTVSAAYLERLHAAIEGLPVLLADKATLDEVPRAAIDRFGLTPETFGAFRGLAATGRLGDWRTWTDRFLRQLLVTAPIIPSTELEAYTTAVRRLVVLPGDPSVPGDGPHAVNVGRTAVELRADDPAAMRARLLAEASEAGFPVELGRMVVSAVITDPKPTIEFDANATRIAADDAAAGVKPVVDVHARGEALFVPGDELTAAQVDRAREEQARVDAAEGAASALGAAGAGAALAAVVALLLLAFGAFGDRELLRDWRRLAMVLALVALPTAVAVPAAAYLPAFAGPAALGASVLAASVLSIAFGVRVALFATVLQAVLQSVSVGSGTGLLLADVAACTVACVALRDVRQRSTLVSAAFLAAATAGAAVLLARVFGGASSGAALSYALREALQAAIAALFVGFLVTGLLPTIERLFGVTTGLTLAELRDPKQPLLRELQRLAPGTWNHSLQVANIAEAAAESIGANGLLTYVGALYHDVGKMNKPEYFVENQTGQNRHDRLSPAMSLLVIVGHVKDGMELAAEYRLPRSVRHFIESHHGTTLMEYFFAAAQRRAGDDELNEADFRYPGPKPQTREAAVLMLSDCVESASRTLSEPTPARIEQLVRDLAHKRLVDGQFDESPLTFRELRIVEDSIIKSMNAIYHGRISYPRARQDRDDGRGEVPLPKVAS